MTTKDEALRVAREEMARYLPILMRLEDSPLWAEFTAGLGIATTNGYAHALRTIALAGEAPSIDVEAMLVACVPGGSICDPQQVADAIRAYFADRAAVRSVALGDGWGELRKDFDLASASGAVGETAPTREQIMEQAVRWHDENTLGGPDCEHRQLEMLAYVEGYSAALAGGLPATSNDQQKGGA